jgi:hypothetical protein
MTTNASEEQKNFRTVHKNVKAINMSNQIPDDQKSKQLGARACQVHLMISFICFVPLITPVYASRLSHNKE